MNLFRARILLVEDDYLVGFDLRNEMSRRGADVIGPVGSLEQALKVTKLEVEIDAAVVDINLHGEMAFPLVDELVRRDIVSVFSTGYDQEVLPSRLRDLPLFTKPTPASEVAQAIADLIMGQRSSDR
jgi:ActR/RegA family two-component response regulator